MFEAYRNVEEHFRTHDEAVEEAIEEGEEQASVRRRCGLYGVISFSNH
jgi:hypothetical protein